MIFLYIILNYHINFINMKVNNYMTWFEWIEYRMVDSLILSVIE
jgi:hypothetical protein